MLEFDFDAIPSDAPAGNSGRFGDRWRLVGAGLSNVWRYGDLDLPAPTGRILLRGPNGTGKTTALEALWPFLLDLDGSRLAAGKSRQTTLRQLMSEGHASRGRRYGYAWLSFEPPTVNDRPDTGIVSYGVRLQYSPGSSPAVKIVPFRMNGRPIHELDLTGPGGSAIEYEDFCQRVNDLGGDVFDSPEEYVEDLSGRLWSATPKAVRDLAQRLREVRNPTLLGNVSPAEAAAALRESLPGVSSEVLSSTAEALAESDTTREAFERDRQAAEALADFSRVWAGHVTDIAKQNLAELRTTLSETEKLRRELSRAEDAASVSGTHATESEHIVVKLAEQETGLMNLVRAIEQSDEYRAVGRVADLQQRLTAEWDTAHARSENLVAASATARRGSEAGAAALDEAIDQIVRVLADAKPWVAATPEINMLLAYRQHQRRVRSVGGVATDPGHRLELTYGEHELNALVYAWANTVKSYRTEAGTAQILLKDYEAVETADATRAAAIRKCSEAETKYDDEQRDLSAATNAARWAVAALLEAITPWLDLYPELRALDPDDPSAGHSWGIDEVRALRVAETAEIVGATTEWATRANYLAEQIAASHDSAATSYDLRADRLTVEADDLRAHARRLRDGQLLPFPRPDWSGPGNDDQSLGSVLEWQPGVDAAERDRIETALSASGLLSAYVETDTLNAAAKTALWRVGTSGPAERGESLEAVLTVDPNHEFAGPARAILARIRLADTADRADERQGIVIGRDGTFAAGQLAGNAAAAALAAMGTIKAAEHVGARTRRQRALAEAKALEARAIELIEEAATAHQQAKQARKQAGTVRQSGRSFPDRRPVERAEDDRVGAARRTEAARGKLAEAQSHVQSAQTDYQLLRDEWSARARELRMPTAREQLETFLAERKQKALSLENCVARLRELLTRTLPRTLGQLLDEDDLVEKLASLEEAARRAHEAAEGTAVLLVEANAAGDVEDAIRRHVQAKKDLEIVATRLGPTREKAQEDRNTATRDAAAVDPARNRLHEVLPRLTNTESDLSALISWPPVAAALQISEFLDAAGLEQIGDGQALANNLAALLDGKPTAARRTVQERYDNVRAELAQTWTLARGDAPDGMNVEMFVLTHADEVHDPHSAATRAAILADRAQAALADAEAAALRDFVIGRLPTAIGVAWTTMQDWRNEVNAKMRSAQSSSGVGVQVRINLREDLDAATQTVYDLSCEVSDAVRTDEQKQKVGQAITSLLAAADGDAMAERIAKAVDITSWVDVKYLVERPGPDGERTSKIWGSRTGLSGGERRLVVLAPMLAAIAANYDRLASDGLRLVPLDEVPAEVDEQGREGLARYLAELDLDIICTSYLWDGAPGAWDGIDAQDLEAAADGTVVAFPMLVRGLQPVPGDLYPIAVIRDAGEL